MKKQIYLTLLFLYSSIGLLKAQETPPAILKSVNAQFYISLADSSIWHYKGRAPDGTDYGFERLAKYKDINTVSGLFKLKADSILSTGYATKLFAARYGQLGTDVYFKSQTIKGTAGLGYVSLPTQSVKPAGVSGELRLYRDSLGRLSYMNGPYRRTFIVPKSIDRSISYPYNNTNAILADSAEVRAKINSKADSARLYGSVLPGYVPNSRTISTNAGTGLLGGGNLGSSLSLSNDTTFFSNKYSRKGSGVLKFNNRTANVAPQSVDYSQYYLQPYQSNTMYITTYDVTKDFNCPPDPDIKTRSLVVSGSAGSTTLSVVSGTQSYFTGKFTCIIYDGSKYKSYYCLSVSSGVITLSTPLTSSVVSGVFTTLWDVQLGQHLTTNGYKALADYVYDLSPRYARKNSLFLFRPDQDTSPLLATGGALSGGFVPGTTDLPNVYQTLTLTQSADHLGDKAFAIYQGGIGRGISYSQFVGGKSGYFQTTLAIRPIVYTPTGGGSATTAGIAVINVYKDNVLIYTQNVTSINFQLISVPFDNANNIRFTVTTGDGTPTAIVMGRVGIYQSNAVITDKLFVPSDKVVLAGDSWTRFQLPDLRDWQHRLQERFFSDGGDSTQIMLSGRSGMTSKWLRYWFQTLVLDKHPNKLIYEYYINDNNSAGDTTIKNWNFSKISPYDVTDNSVSGNTTLQDWIDNREWTRQQCEANGIQFIVVMPSHAANVTQAQALLKTYLPTQANDGYYDIFGAFTNSIKNQTSITTNTLISKDTISTSSVTVTPKIVIGTPVVGGTGAIEYQENNSGAAKGVVMRPSAFRTVTGSGGHLATLQNGNGSNAYTDSYYWTNDGTTMNMGGHDFVQAGINPITSTRTNVSGAMVLQDGGAKNSQLFVGRGGTSWQQYLSAELQTTTISTTVTYSPINGPQFLEFTGGSALTTGLGTNTAVATIVGSTIRFRNSSAFVWNISMGTGVTVNGSASNLVINPSGEVGIVNTGVNTWRVYALSSGSNGTVTSVTGGFGLTPQTSQTTTVGLSVDSAALIPKATQSDISSIKVFPGSAFAPRLQLLNRTAATSSVPQSSPSLRLGGYSWETTGNTSQAVSFDLNTQAFVGTLTPQGRLNFTFNTPSGSSTSSYISSDGTIFGSQFQSGTYSSGTLTKFDATGRIVAATPGTDYLSGSSARTPVTVSSSITMSLNADYLNTTATQYTLTLPTCGAFTTDGSKIITVLCTGTGGAIIRVPSGYAMQSGTAFATTTGTGGVTLTQGQKVQIIPVGTNSYYLQPLNGSVTLY